MYRSFRKYQFLFALGFKNAIMYRVELLLWGVLNLMPLIATLALWLSVYGDRATIAGYSQTSLVVYYLLGFVCSELTGAYFEQNAVSEIRQGSMAGPLTKPYSIKASFIVHEIGWRVIGFIAAFVPLFITVAVVTQGQFPPMAWHHVALLPVFLLLAYLIECSLSLLIVAMGFVFEQAESLTHLKWMLSWLLSGSMMPFEFMPSWLQDLAGILPFQFRYFVPVKLLLNELSPDMIVQRLLLSLVWLLVIGLFLRWLWNRNIRAFTAVGN